MVVQILEVVVQLRNQVQLVVVIQLELGVVHKVLVVQEVLEGRLLLVDICGDALLVLGVTNQVPM